MAGSYTPNDAIAMARLMSHKIPAAAVQAYACDIVNSTIWTKFPWNWTQTSLTAIALSDGVQDYALSSSGSPSDVAQFYRMVNLRIVRPDLTPIEYREMVQKSHAAVELTQKGGLDSIRFFSYEGAISKIRLDRAAAVPSGISLQLQGEYQIKPTRITDANMGIALAHPDHYFSVFLEGVRWKLYELGNDARAGIMRIDEEGRQSYTGQLGVFMNALFAMQQAEDLSNGEDPAFPSDPLGAGTTSFVPAIFG